MQFSRSLKLNHVFRRLYRKGGSYADRNLVLYCRKNGSRENRIGLTVGVKLGHAVVRNRIRRRAFCGRGSSESRRQRRLPRQGAGQSHQPLS